MMSNSASGILVSDQDPSPPSRRGSRQWIAAAIATAIVVVAIAAISAQLDGDARHDVARDGTSPAGSGGGSQPRPGQTAVRPTEQVVRDGDQVVAEGQLIAVPGGPFEICPLLPVISIYPPPPPSCSGFGFTATGVDLDQVDGEVRDGIFVASVWVHGIYQGGREIEVTEIGPVTLPAQQPEGDIREEPPCDPPAGGWPGVKSSTVLDNLQQYISVHGDRFNGLRVIYPPGATWDPVDLTYDLEVYVVGVAGGDPKQALEELRSEVGGNICTVAVPRTSDHDRRTEAAIQRLAEDPRNGIYSYGSGNGFEPMRVEILVLDERMYGEFGAIGFERLNVQPWLKPAGNRA